MGRSAVIAIAAVLVVLFLFTRQPAGGGSQDTPQFGPSSATTGHLKVVPTIRSVTVTPGTVTFGNCTGGSGATNSSEQAMGYPNGSCSVGAIGVNETFPIAVSYTGLPGNVYVSSSNAVPADGGTPWSLCSPQGKPSCTGGQGLPGSDQYMIMNFAPQVPNATVLTTTSTCDAEFDPGGGCTASPQEFAKQTQHEGLLLTGPRTWDDHSTSWTLTVTWTAVGPQTTG